MTSDYDPMTVDMITAPDLSVTVTEAEIAAALDLFDRVPWEDAPVPVDKAFREGTMGGCVAIACGHPLEKCVELLGNHYFVHLAEYLVKLYDDTEDEREKEKNGR